MMVWYSSTAQLLVGVLILCFQSQPFSKSYRRSGVALKIICVVRCPRSSLRSTMMKAGGRRYCVQHPLSARMLWILIPVLLLVPRRKCKLKELIITGFGGIALLVLGGMLLFMWEHRNPETEVKSATERIRYLQNELEQKDQQILELQQKSRAANTQTGLDPCRSKDSEIRSLGERIAQCEKDLGAKKNLGGGSMGGGGGRGRSTESSLFRDVEINQFCTDELSDEDRWWKTRKTWLKKKIHAGQKGEWPFITYYPPFWWCDKFPRYNEPHIETKTKPEDLAVVIFTGERLRYGRVLAIKATWGSILPKLEVYSAEEDKQLGITGNVAFAVVVQRKLIVNFLSLTRPRGQVQREKRQNSAFWGYFCQYFWFGGNLQKIS